MSADNSIARAGGDVEQPAETVGFQMPPALASRYELRVIDGADGEQRLGLFRPQDRENPSIDITNDRIVARSEDPETVAALVTIAKSSGWERIAVDGSPQFRQTVWEAATREGLAVGGYEPSFAEQARVEEARRPATEREARVRSRSRPYPTGDGPPGVSRSSDDPERRAANERLHEGEELAEIFLQGSDADRIAAEPRLAQAMQAQAAMEQHIGEVFGSDIEGTSVGQPRKPADDLGRAQAWPRRRRPRADAHPAARAGPRSSRIGEVSPAMEKHMKSESFTGRLISDRRARQVVGIAGALALIAIAQPALAQSGGTAIEGGLNTIKQWMVTIASVVGVIAVMAVGYAKLTGRMDWGRAVTVLIGIGIIFSATTIVGWMSSGG